MANWNKVAPFTGAWIEIVIDVIAALTDSVAPFTGAWIEINYHDIKPEDVAESHPSRVRGLK